MEETRDVSHFGMEPLSKFDIRERHMLVSYVQQAESFRLLQRVYGGRAEGTKSAVD